MFPQEASQVRLVPYRGGEFKEGGSQNACQDVLVVFGIVN